MNSQHLTSFNDSLDSILAHERFEEEEKIPDSFEEYSTLISHRIHETKQFLQTTCRVLVVGAGGLGCEILKNLALMRFGQLDIIDMDTIESSNLNRQFLFKEEDIGRPKAEVAARSIEERCGNVKVTAHYGRIQDYSLEFYRQFDMIICGLDSIESRRWMNAMLFQIFQEQTDRIIPMLDGGTEGFKGHVRIIIPEKTACFECTLDAFPPQTTYPICTLAHTPRRPEHCIEWAVLLEWPRQYPNIILNIDSPDHLNLIYQMAFQRSQLFQIHNVTYALTQTVVKQIIPAIASTNSIVASISVNEAFKIATGISSVIQNYMMINVLSGIYTYTFEYKRKPDCLICGHSLAHLSCSKTITLNHLIQHLLDDQRFQLRKPSIRTLSGKTLYMQAPSTLEEMTRPQLNLPLSTLLDHETEVTCIVTDPTFPNYLHLHLSLL
jgi:ubiquitin-activating enzyme E1 C